MADRSQNSLKPVLEHENKDRIDSYIMRSKELAIDCKMDYMTREASLFVLMEHFPTIVTDLEALGIDGPALYNDLYFQFETYQEHGSPVKRGREQIIYYDDESRTQDLWREKKTNENPKADIEMISLLKSRLQHVTRKEDLNEEEQPNAAALIEKSRQDLLLQAFLLGAEATESAKEIEDFAKNSMLHIMPDYQLLRTPPLEEHLFEAGPKNTAVLNQKAQDFLYKEKNQPEQQESARGWRTRAEEVLAELELPKPLWLFTLMGFALINSVTAPDKKPEPAKPSNIYIVMPTENGDSTLHQLKPVPKPKHTP